jgi:hypothetical protein
MPATPISVRNYSSTSLPTQITTTVDNQLTTTNIPVRATAGYPAAPFTGCFERNTPNQEFVLVTAVPDGNHFTVVRGYDSTPAVQHLAPATFEHCVGAVDYREANWHHTDATRDDHPQYLLTSGLRPSTGLQVFNGGITVPNINGATNFNTVPTVPGYPTALNQVANKQYVDQCPHNVIGYAGYVPQFVWADWAAHTTDANGYFNVTFQQPFGYPTANGICDFLIFSLFTAGGYIVVTTAATRTGAQGRVIIASSGAAGPNLSITVSYFGMGHG